MTEIIDDHPDEAEILETDFYVMQQMYNNGKQHMHYNNVNSIRRCLQINEHDDSDIMHSHVVNYCILLASIKNHIEILSMLVSDRRSDVNTICLAIRLAALCNNTACLLRMLNNIRDRRDPQEHLIIPLLYSLQNDVECIRIRDFMEATYVGNVEYFRKLHDNRFQDINPAISDNCAILYSISRNNVEIVRILLEDPRVNPFVYNNDAIHFAISNGYIRIAVILVNYYHNLNPIINSKFLDEILTTAAIYGRARFMKLLLKKFPLYKLPVNTDGETLWDIAIGHDGYDTPRVLYNDPRIYSLDLTLIYYDEVNGGDYQIHLDMIEHGMFIIKDRVLEICIALQHLALPALMTLEIIDQLIPNPIPMYKKWNLIVLVKHWDR